MLGFRVVLGVPLNGGWPVVGGPEDIEPGVFPATGLSAETRKQVNCCEHGESLPGHARALVLRWPPSSKWAGP